MKKACLTLFVISFLILSCSKDNSSPVTPTEAFPSQTKSLLGSWIMNKTTEETLYNGTLSLISTTTPNFAAEHVIRFTDALYLSQPNTKAVYDSSTGLVHGTFNSGFYQQDKWNVFHQDSVSIGIYKYYISKLTNTELILLRRKYFPANDYVVTTWFFTK